MPGGYVAVHSAGLKVNGLVNRIAELLTTMLSILVSGETRVRGVEHAVRNSVDTIDRKARIVSVILL